MAKNLKQQNQFALVAVLLVNLAVFGVLITTNTLIFPGLAGGPANQWKSAIPSSLAVIVCGVLNEQFGPNTKARIVFWRWSNPLPGSEAFSKYGPRDPRIDMNAVAHLVGTLPSERARQNALWYSLFKRVANDPSVYGAHKAFLFNRDYACISLFLLVFLTPIAFWRVKPATTAVLYFGMLLCQYLIVRNAAVNTGRGFVTNVLAASTNE